MATVTGLTASAVLALEAALDARVTALEAGAGLPDRRTENITTASIASDVEVEVNDNLGKRSLVYSAAANRPCRIRAYGKDSHRDADAARPIGTDPDEESGCLMELVFTDDIPAIICVPQPNLINLDTVLADTIYFLVQNLDDASGIVDVTLILQGGE